MHGLEQKGLLGNTVGKGWRRMFFPWEDHGVHERDGCERQDEHGTRVLNQDPRHLGSHSH